MTLLRENLDLSQSFSKSRNFTEFLAKPLSAEDMQVQTMPDTSPTKWHLAHTSWFYETFLLEPNLANYQVFDENYNYLFNSYYNAVGSRHLRSERGHLSRPSINQVMDYRYHVTEAMQVLLEREELQELILLGINHEQQHQELMLTDIKHVLGTNPLQEAYRHDLKKPTSSEQDLNWQHYSAGIFQMGHANGTVSSFAFDNEGPRHQVYIEPFLLASRLVTNAEYLEFIEDGGYSNPKFWLSDAWTWLQQEKITMPLYWSNIDGVYKRYALTGLEDLQLNQPVSHISFYEADAYARWLGARLPLEAEWEFAAQQKTVEGNFIENDLLEPETSGSIFGNLWQWTSSPYTAYPGFKVADGAIGEYNGKFMSNQMVLRGGSCASSQDHLRATYRNFFYPTSRWQFTGIRLAKDAY